MWALRHPKGNEYKRGGSATKIEGAEYIKKFYLIHQQSKA